ncbi:MAG: metallophosphoesterase [Lachnospiraceae bacterium]|nr:metallophosphoesterase [Ruminococcus sp.]MCM1276588.1 metallophosphoesterase [Lachnospiraceae bacterium]
MTYVISDIHGRYDKYTAMLDKIRLGDDDALYVLGDIIDRHDDGLKIMLDIIRRPNAFLIMGNHEAMMLDALLGMTEISEESVEKLMMWLLNGGESTMEAYLGLGEPDRILILDTLEALLYYKELEAGGKKFVLLHGGLENFSPERPLGSYPRDDIVWTDTDFDAEYFPDKYLVVGHMPTTVFCDEPKIFRKGRIFDVDCGIADKSDTLGCLRLDDFSEFYV